MINLHNFIKHIVNFLNEKESLKERKELYDWYNETNINPQVSTEARITVGAKARNRIINSLDQNSPKGVLYYKWYATAAAVLVVLLGSWLMWEITKEGTISEKHLAKYVPAQKNTIIKLPSGETVNLDKIALGESTQVGDILIIKSPTGEVSYQSLTSNMGSAMSILETAESSNAHIKLSDGTIVHLNSESKLYYPLQFGSGDRIVTLEGEGYFEVQKTDKHNKFIVKTAGQKVEVLGTKFNIKTKFTPTIKTTLVEGSVRVHTNFGNVLLAPLQQGVLTDKNFGVTNANLEEVLAWTKGYFYFDGNNTKEVLNQIERWYSIQISYNHQTSFNNAYVGKIPKNLSLDKLIKVLSMADFQVDATINKSNKINLNIK